MKTVVEIADREGRLARRAGRSIAKIRKLEMLVRPFDAFAYAAARKVLG